MNLGDQSATRAADCLISVFWCAGGMQVISQYGAVDADLLEVGIHLRFIAVLAPKCAWPFTADHGRPHSVDRLADHKGKNLQECVSLKMTVEKIFNFPSTMRHL